MLTEPWRIYLLGTFRVVSGDKEFCRCSTRKTEEVLALLAYRLGQQCARSELVDLFWPDSEIEAGFTNLRGSLLSLRRQLEPHGVPRGSVLVSHGRHAVSLNPEAVTCDVVDFRRLIKKRTELTREERTRRLLAAIELYKGELLPGHDEEWIEDIRRSLAEQFFSALRELSSSMAEAGEIDQAIEHAHRAVIQEPYREETHCELMRLYALAGRPEDAMRTYEHMARLFERESLDPPSGEAWRLFEQVRRSVPSQSPRKSPSQATSWPPSDGHPPSPTAPRRETRNPTRVAREPDAPPPAASGRTARPPVAPDDPEPVHAEPGVDSVRRSDTGIPLQFTRFFGREQELQRLDAMVQSGQERLITITGPGGMGKTRLSVEYAARALTTLDRRIVFVALGDLHSAAEAATRVAEGLGVRIQPGGPDVLTLIETELALRPTLLILDNLEQLVDEITPMVHRLISSVTTLRIVVTSRRALDLSWEQLFPLEPLPVPDETTTEPEDLLECPSVQLFVDRATRVVPDFAITPRNAGDVAKVCRELEGLPLSIELAAALAQDRSPRQMVRDLSNKFDLLVSTKRDVPERHATLRACLEWSYRLLPDRLARTFSGLSVFRGGFTLEDAEAVCELETPLSTLKELRSRSLISAQRSDDEVRYGMLDALRAFAAEKLPDDRRMRLERRHAAHFAEMCAQAEPHLWSSDQSEWIGRLTSESANLRTALAWALDNDPPTAIAMGRDLGRFFIVKGYWSEGRGWLSRCAQAAETRGDRLGEGALLSLAGALAACEGAAAEAVRIAESGVALVRSAEDKLTLARSLINLGIAYQWHGDLAAARGAFDESLGYAEAAGARHIAAIALGNAASACILAGQYPEAAALAQRALSLARELGDGWLCSMLLMHLGDIASEMYDAESALRHYGEAVQLLVAADAIAHVPQLLWRLAAILAYSSDPAGAAFLMGAATSLRQRTRAQSELDPGAVYQDVVAETRRQLGANAFEASWTEGTAADVADIPSWLASRKR